MVLNMVVYYAPKQGSAYFQMKILLPNDLHVAL